MEIIAMDMKLRGSYIARQLSFAGVSFEIGEVPMENHYKELFNDCVDLVSTKKVTVQENNLFNSSLCCSGDMLAKSLQPLQNCSRLILALRNTCGDNFGELIKGSSSICACLLKSKPLSRSPRKLSGTGR